MEVVRIQNGIVEAVMNVVDIASAQDYYPDCIFLPRVANEDEGWRYNGVDFMPPVGQTDATNTCITNFAFISRFTDAEAVGIDLASQGATPEAAMMRRVQKKSDTAEYIDLQDATTRAGVMMLEQYGFIAPGRAAEILDTPPLTKELFKG